MKRSLSMTLGVMLLTLAVPSIALAHHGHRGHHHKVNSRAHHAKFRFVHVGAAVTTAPGAPSGSSTTQPTAPTSTPENAGTVASYTNNVLTLTLNDGSTVSGKVTSGTDIRCIKATPTPTTEEGGDHSQGDDNGEGDDQSRGDMSQQGNQQSGGDSGQSGDDGGEPQDALEPPCDTSALVSGAVVRDAELRIGPGGTEFESVWLVR
jgi:hypothetical protein